MLTEQEFLMKLSETLEVNPPLTGREALSDLAEWDSLAVINFMALAEAEYGIVVAPKEIGSCTTVNQLIALVYERKAASLTAK